MSNNQVSKTPVRRLILAALLSALLLPLLGWAVGEPRLFATIGLTLASLWWLMAGVAMWQRRRHPDVEHTDV